MVVSSNDNDRGKVGNFIQSHTIISASVSHSLRRLYTLLSIAFPIVHIHCNVQYKLYRLSSLYIRVICCANISCCNVPISMRIFNVVALINLKV